MVITWVFSVNMLAVDADAAVVVAAAACGSMRSYILFLKIHMVSSGEPSRVV